MFATGLVVKFSNDWCLQLLFRLATNNNSPMVLRVKSRFILLEVDCRYFVTEMPCLHLLAVTSSGMDLAHALSLIVSYCYALREKFAWPFLSEMIYFSVLMIRAK